MSSQHRCSDNIFKNPSIPNAPVPLASARYYGRIMNKEISPVVAALGPFAIRIHCVAK